MYYGGEAGGVNRLISHGRECFVTVKCGHSRSFYKHDVPIAFEINHLLSPTHYFISALLLS